MAPLLTSLVLLGAIIFFIWAEMAAQRLKIPAVPIMPWQCKAIAALIQKHAPQAQNIVDLGSGWGGILAMLTHTFPQATVTGYELFTPAWLFSRVRFINSPRVTLKRRDLFTADLSNADVVVCYLSHWHMEKLKEKFARELKPGTILISNAFPIPDWQTVDEITRGIFRIYVYKTA